MSSSELAHEAARHFHTETRNGADPADAMREIINLYGIDTARTVSRLGLALYHPTHGPQQHAYIRALRIAWRTVIQPTRTPDPATGRAYEESTA